jgi:hypothetical protein
VNLFSHELGWIDIVNIMKKIGELSAVPNNNNIYTLETLFSTLENPSFRTTTFIGVLYDLINNMKIPIKNLDTYNLWLTGNADIIKQNFLKDVQPLDWFISRNTSWCKSLGTRVIDLNDLIKLGFNIGNAPLYNGLPDYGNYITDHMPLINTIEIKSPKSISQEHQLFIQAHS